ncbi:type II secretion system F family protein [Modestobacter sp. Leaf380]|uniref:type II secretion system F family protein n=1 Tax=Modestobacter sp. Leaf380 TaxID=1736356 RepID=UPI001F1A8F2F|nr:type II secretion system F family protein [Modestobacter sp. Leaf380]
MPAVLLCLAAALLLWAPARHAGADRLRRPPAPGATLPTPPAGPRRRWVVAGVAAAAVLALGGIGPGTVVVAGAAAVGLERWQRRAAEGPGGDADARRVRADLPVAADLLAVCLSGGTPVTGAVAAVGVAVGGPLGGALDDVAGRLRLGASARAAWADVPEGAAALARVVVRAGESGSAVVPALQRLAADSRVAERAATSVAVQRAGVWVLAPLGLCFLPAFLCLGVAPLVLGIAADVFG